MTKNAKSLVSLVVAAAVLGGAFGGLRLYNKRSEEKKQEEADAAVIHLAQLADVNKMSVTNANGTFSFTYDSDADTWSYDGDANLPLLQSKMTTLTGDVKDLTAERELTGADDLSEYGLDSPQITFTAENADGPVTLQFGDKSAASSDYYVKLSDSDTVYTVSPTIFSALNFTEDDLVQTVTFPTITAANITKLVWTSGDDTVTWHQETREVEETSAEDASVEEVSAEDGTDESAERSAQTAADGTAAAAEAQTDAADLNAVPEGSQEETSEESETESYWVTDLGGTDAEPEDTTNFQAGLDLIASLSYDGWADYYMDDDEAKTYGLDEASNPETLTITYTSLGDEKTVKLTIGTTTEDGTDYYCVQDDSTFVNKIAASTVVQLVTDLTEEGSPESAAEEETAADAGMALPLSEPESETASED